jgi:DNA-binding MarR family transcriptional regulator
MTNRIDGMVRRGLVERRTDPNDGRGVLVSMTPEGRDRVDAAISHLVAAESELLSGLNKADQERLAALLRRLSIEMA